MTALPLDEIAVIRATEPDFGKCSYAHNERISRLGYRR